MKKQSLYLLAVVIICFACDRNTTSSEANEVKKDSITFPEKLAAATIYEVNIRQHTPDRGLDS